MEQLDGCVSFIVVFKFPDICRLVSYSSRVTNEISSACFFRLVASHYLCFSEGRVTSLLGAVIRARRLIDSEISSILLTGQNFTGEK